MRTTMTLILAVLLSLGFAVTSFAVIEGSVHDLSPSGSSSFTSLTSQNNEICIYCHSPHVADITVVDYNPLWNMAIQTATDFDAYDSATLDAVNTGDPLIGPSRLCMSCHDGTIALDSALLATGGTIIGTPGSDNRFLVGDGGDLTSDHPIGFDYETVGGTAATSGTGSDLEIFGSGASYGGGATTILDYLYNDGTDNYMTCATCHDPHNGSTDTTNRFFLVASNANSDLCLSCHDK